VPDDCPVIDLASAPGAREAWDKPRWIVYLWSACELILVSNPWQISSALRTCVLRAFGAEIGQDVILRPRLRVKFPWKLKIGDRSWIGEDVWLHNQDNLDVGSDAVISQGTFVTTGSHRYASDMALLTTPVTIADGVWITARCVVLAGATIGQSAVILPNTVVRGCVPPGTIWGTPAGVSVGKRFSTKSKIRPPSNDDFAATQ